MTNHFLIVGAGFTGCTAARVLAERGYRVTIFERRGQLGGNAYDEFVDGVFVHRYGPHLFHTNSHRVAEFVQRFSYWRPYKHAVQGVFQDLVYPLPPNFVLLDLIFGNYSNHIKRILCKHFGREQRVPLHLLETSDSRLIRAAAERIAEIVYTPYTTKMWGPYASELLTSTKSRVPFVVGYSSGYFTDTFQALPTNGYRAFFGNLVDHVSIEIVYESFDLALVNQNTRVLYTGPLDELLDYSFGALPYRSIDFKVSASRERLPVGTINYNDWRAPTRVTDMALTVSSPVSATVLVEETPQDYIVGKNEPLYPIQATRWRRLHNRYAELVTSSYPNLTIAGRMGRYQYYDMDQACATALRIGMQL